MGITDPVACIPEAVTDPRRWFDLWQMLKKKKTADHAITQFLALPEWSLVRIYDGKVYIFMPGVVLIYEYFHLVQFVRAFQKENPK